MDFKKEYYIIDKAYARMILTQGAPMAVQAGAINLSMLFVNSMVNNVGVVASATFGVGCRIDDIVNKYVLIGYTENDRKRKIGELFKSCNNTYKKYLSIVSIKLIRFSKESFRIR